ncbi:uncharacterized protein [Haliotis cracherodii]|uniref:uncharacterized protein n=1 Tax=Haliotis cracherodii TaxID=6455 RepID=UPI0039EA609B
MKMVNISTRHTSKACYGTPFLSCTMHAISCNSSQKIAIYDAYFTNNTECGAAISSCTVNPDSVTEHGHHRFNNTELVSLYNHCSTETRCVYRATRHSAAFTFSVVRYQCIERDFTTAPDKDRYPISISSQFPGGAFVGGVAVGVVIVILVCLAVYVVVVRRRYDLTQKKQGDTPASIEHPNYSGMSAGGDVNNYDIIEQTSGFQGETAHDVAATPDYQNL